MQKLAYSLAILVLSFNLNGQNNYSQKLKSVDALLSKAIANEDFSGSLVIIDPTGQHYEKHAGLANRTWDLPVTQNTKFDIASVNKLFIATLTMIAVEEQRLSLNTKLVDLVKNMNYQGSFDEGITIHHMLSHTAGLPDYEGVAEDLRANNFNPFKRKRFSSNQAYVDFISQLNPVGAPGKQFYYSNFAYHLLPIILEEIYQMPFGDLLKMKISDQLGLENTISVSSNEEIIPNLAIGYLYDFETKSWRNNNFIDLTLGRRIFSNALDLSKFAQALSQGTLLKSSSYEQITQNHLKTITSDLAYGYGIVPFGASDHFRMGDLDIDVPYLIHGGNTEGFRSMFVIINNGEWTITLTGNSGNRLNEMELTKEIANLITH